MNRSTRFHPDRPAPSSTAGRGRRRRSTILAALAVVCTWIGAEPVAAHLGIESSNPANAAEVTTAPSEATLTFSAAVDVTSASAQLRYLGPPDLDITQALNRDVRTEQLTRMLTVDRTAVFDLPELGPGTYAIDWSVDELGGHENASFILFKVTGSTDSVPIAALAVGAVGALSAALMIWSIARRRGGR